MEMELQQQREKLQALGIDIWMKINIAGLVEFIIAF